VSFRQTTVAGFPALALRSDLVELVVVPAAGMRITNLRRHRGREWLWHNPDIPLAPPRRGASYIETADSGGWDECFPTVSPSPVPGFEPPLNAPDHGELWQSVWTASVFDHAQGTTLRAAVRGERLPYELTREVSVDPHEPVVRFRYHLVHTGGPSFPWIWSSHPLLNVQPGSTLEVPGLRQVRVDQAHGRPDLQRNDMVSWAGAIGGEADRFTFPEPAGWALKLFGDLPHDATMRVTDPHRGERLELSVNGSEVPQVGMWINAGGWAPSGIAPYYNLALEPCIGAPDSLADAVEEWGTAQTLEPGGERSWGVDVQLFEADD
jgi:galactose mutarotase-like enzyme